MCEQRLWLKMELVQRDTEINAERLQMQTDLLAMELELKFTFDGIDGMDALQRDEAVSLYAQQIEGIESYHSVAQQPALKQKQIMPTASMTAVSRVIPSRRKATPSVSSTQSTSTSRRNIVSISMATSLRRPNCLLKPAAVKSAFSAAKTGNSKWHARARAKH